MIRPYERKFDQMREVKIELNPLKFPEGSALIDIGNTRVLVTATVENRVPPFLQGCSQGWITAEYAMLPRATPTRTVREVLRGRPSGRTSEIQRLIGRSLRAAVDLSSLGERTIYLDCDVLQADGGTRTAAITAAYVALYAACAKLFLQKDLKKWPVVNQVAAVSVGIVEGEILLDLEFVEDSIAEVDLNIIGTADQKIVEVQVTAEKKVFDLETLNEMIRMGQKGIRELVEIQNRVLQPIKETIDYK